MNPVVVIVSVAVMQLFPFLILKWKFEAGIWGYEAHSVEG